MTQPLNDTPAQQSREEIDERITVRTHELTTRVRAAASLGAAAFYKALADSFPEVLTGDVDPEADARFDDACYLTAFMWVLRNMTSEVLAHGVRPEPGCKFYFTVTASQHSRGPGCVEVTAPDASEARRIMHGVFGSRWSFQYDSLEDVHEADRKIIGRLGGAR